MGKLAPAKGYLAGLKISGIFLLILLLLNLITSRTLFNLPTIIYYLILIISSVLGGMFGINKKNLNKN